MSASGKVAGAVHRSVYMDSSTLSRRCCHSAGALSMPASSVLLGSQGQVSWACDGMLVDAVSKPDQGIASVWHGSSFTNTPTQYLNFSHSHPSLLISRQRWLVQHYLVHITLQLFIWCLRHLTLF